MEINNEYVMSPYLSEENDMSFYSIIEEFLRLHQLKVKFSTYVRYVEIIHTHINPFFGSMDVIEFSQEIVNRYIFWLTSYKKDNGKSLAPKTIKDILSLLKIICHFAEKKGYIAHRAIEFEIPRQNKNFIKVLTKNQQEILEAFICSNTDSYKFGVFLCLYTGLRIGELCALRWNDIDCENMIIYVNKTVLRLKNINDTNSKNTKLFISSPKTATSERLIPIPAQLANILREQKSRVSIDENPYVLTGTLKIIEPRNYYRRYKSYMQKCNLSEFNFHALRHTFATRCIEIGVDPKVLSEILGHSSVKITLDRYVHPSMESKRNSLNKLFLISPNFSGLPQSR